MGKATVPENMAAKPQNIQPNDSLQFHVYIDQSWHLFLRAYKHVMRSINNEMHSRHSITLAEYELLLNMDIVGGKIRLLDLARMSLLSQSRVSRQIDNLVDRGYVKKQQNVVERRSKFAILTESGRIKFNEATSHYRAISHKHFYDKITPKDRRAFHTVLFRLLQDPQYPDVRSEIIRETREQNAIDLADECHEDTEDIMMWLYFLKSYKIVTDLVDRDLIDSCTITLADFEILHILSEASGKIRFVDLSEVATLSQSRISRQIKTLQKTGLVEKLITDQDRRATYAVITQAGTQQYDAAKDEFLRLYSKYFCDLIPKKYKYSFRRTLFALVSQPDFEERMLNLIVTARKQNSIAS